MGSQDERVPAHQSQALPPLRPTGKAACREWKNTRRSRGLCIHSDLGIKKQSCTLAVPFSQGAFLSLPPCSQHPVTQAGGRDSQAHPCTSGGSRAKQVLLQPRILVPSDFSLIQLTSASSAVEIAGTQGTLRRAGSTLTCGRNLPWVLGRRTLTFVVEAPLKTGPPTGPGPGGAPSQKQPRKLSQENWVHLQLRDCQGRGLRQTCALSGARFPHM